MTRADFIRLGLVLILSGTLLMINFSQAWIGQDGHDGILFSSIARNYLQYGYAELKLGQARTMHVVEAPVQLEYYQHHPFLVPIMTSLSFAVLGVNEAAARLLPIVFSLASVGLMYFITRRLYGTAIALAAAFVFATLPMITFFGRKVGYEAPSLCFILLSIYFYIRILTDKDVKWVWFLALSLGIGLFTDWQTFFFIPFLFMHFWLFGKDAPHRIGIFAMLIYLPTIILALLVIQIWSVQPSDLEDIVNQGKVYMGLLTKTDPEGAKFAEAAVTFTFSSYLKQLGIRLDILFAYPVLVCATMGFWILHKKGWQNGSFVLLMLAAGFAPCIVFWRSVFIHWWDTYFLTAPIAILAALGCGYIYELAFGRISASTDPERKSGIVFLQILFISIVLVGAIPRLYGLHQIQIKLLPEKQRESVELIRNLGQAIAQRSPADGVILINLPSDTRAASGVSYYSWRRLIWNVQTEAQLAAALASVPQPKSVFLLEWIDSGSTPEGAPPPQVVDNKELFNIDEHSFRWSVVR